MGKYQQQQLELAQFAEMKIKGKKSKDIICDATIHFDNIVTINAKQPLIVEFE